MNTSAAIIIPPHSLDFSRDNYYLPSHDTLTKIITHHYFKQYEEELLGKYLLNLSLTAESNSIQFPLYIHWDGFSFCKDGDVANILDRKIQNGDLS